MQEIEDKIHSLSKLLHQYNYEYYEGSLLYAFLKFLFAFTIYDNLDVKRLSYISPPKYSAFVDGLIETGGNGKYLIIKSSGLLFSGLNPNNLYESSVMF
jgi:hypothetical protein